MSWAAAIQAGGALLGGAMAGRGAKNQHLTRNNILRTVLDAKQAGVHPLYALGSGGSYSPQWQASGNDYGLPQAADAIGRGLHQSKAETQAKVAAGIDQRMADSVIDRNSAAADADRAQAALARSQVNQTGLARAGQELDYFMNNSGAFSVPKKKGGADHVMVPPRIPIPNPNDKSRQAGPNVPPMIRVTTPQGGHLDVPNPDLVDSEGLAAWILMANSLGQRYGGATGRAIGKLVAAVKGRIMVKKAKNQVRNRNYKRKSK